MNFMNWLRWVGSAGSPSPKGRKTGQGHNTPEPEASSPPKVDINLESNGVLLDAVECARHALIMEFRAKHKFDPAQEDFADWVNAIWFDQNQVRAIIRNRNPMSLTLGERFQDFWPKLKEAALRAERAKPS